MQKPIPDKGMICPFHQKGVEKVCPKCPLYIQLRGKDPQSGADVDEWGCSFAFGPMLTIENSKQARSGAAATESLRNEMVKGNEMVASAILAIVEPMRAAVSLQMNTKVGMIEGKKEP